MKRKSAAAIAAAAVLTLGAAMGMGYAAWSTTVTGSGSVTAAGNWDVAVTDASVRLSSAGAALSSETVYTFEKTEEAYSNAYKYVGTLSTNDTIKGATEENHATQSELPMQEAAAFYAIDTSRTSWEKTSIRNWTRPATSGPQGPWMRSWPLRTAIHRNEKESPPDLQTMQRRISGISAVLRPVR